jgi:hypothetical protein
MPLENLQSSVFCARGKNMPFIIEKRKKEVKEKRSTTTHTNGSKRVEATVTVTA